METEGYDEVKQEDVNGNDETDTQETQQEHEEETDTGDQQQQPQQQSQSQRNAKGTGPVLPAETEEYLRQVDLELKAIPEGLHLVRTLAERELARINAGEITEQGYVILHKDIPVKIIKKVCIPIKEHPKINFVGRLLGPKGSTLKALQANTQSRIMIFGRGSNRDKAKEEEMRNSGDPKYAHLNEDLHVYIEIHAYPVEAQGRFTHVLNELKKFLDPNHPGYIETDMEGRARTGGPQRPPMRPPPPGMRGPMPPPHKRGRPPPPGPRYGAPRPPPVAAPPPDNSYYYQGGGPPAQAPYQGGYGEGMNQDRGDQGGRRGGGGSRARTSRFEAPKQEVKAEDYSYYPEQSGQSEYGEQAGGNLGYAQYPSQQEYSAGGGGYDTNPGAGAGGYGAPPSSVGGGYGAPPASGGVGGYGAPPAGGGGYAANTYSQGVSQDAYAGYETGWENANAANGAGGGKAPSRGFAAPKKPRPSPYAQTGGY